MSINSADAKRQTLRELLGLRSGDFSSFELIERFDPYETKEGILIEDAMLELGPRAEQAVRVSVARPAQATGPLPAVLCLHGTGQGRNYLLQRPFELDPKEPWLMGWGMEFARRGFAALCFDQLCFGDRGGNVYEQAKINLLLGQPLLGRYVEEAAAVVSYLLTLGSIDPARIFTCGFSLGGYVGFHHAILDTRICGAAIVCGGVGSLRTLITQGDTSYHSTYYYLPHMLEHFDHPDLIDCIAPRALFLAAAESGDRGMPPAGISRFERAARQAYGSAPAFSLHVRGIGHRFDAETFDQIHHWMRQDV